mmetsp:Transcript_17759/g.35718  ORF Transcript_17759/g.35718 Transcript_17759/m.35718 type:complete len:158 (+) Transcript_17759:111-584(+)|eukprot:CAMPEP_0178548156 /NCGR_PEP_ID=MMETSP0697-20121206/5050_1 /TAXON_ID=265572 /ORGANISM="Extubocellulus spinifer, Strain CCMP396" /LENGTH=157 /DNA_ID=CAMNT_0020180821 /DNA_START=83 /DNA_END=556 /DNA_ORIENTATION=+
MKLTIAAVLLGVIASADATQIMDRDGKYCWELDGRVKAGAHIVVAKCKKNRSHQDFNLSQNPDGTYTIKPRRNAGFRVVGVRDDRDNRAWLRLAGKNSDDMNKFDYLSDKRMMVNDLYVTTQGLNVNVGEPVMAITEELLEDHMDAPRSELIYKWYV